MPMSSEKASDIAEAQLSAIRQAGVWAKWLREAMLPMIYNQSWANQKSLSEVSTVMCENSATQLHQFFLQDMDSGILARIASLDMVLDLGKHRVSLPEYDDINSISSVDILQVPSFAKIHKSLSDSSARVYRLQSYSQTGEVLSKLEAEEKAHKNVVSVDEFLTATYDITAAMIAKASRMVALTDYKMITDIVSTRSSAP